jgi:hypothetical protein
MINKTRLPGVLAAIAGTIISTSTPAQAVNVSFSGTLVNLCILTPALGTLGLATDGSRLGSAEPGGLAATMTVVGTGSTPTLTIGAPTLTGPTGTSSAVTTLSYTSVSGANQAFTGSQTTTTASLLDTFTFNARVTKSGGFPSGIYTVTSVVTCAQP